MNELLAKLTNFGYELTGIFLPGLIAILFLLLWWTALGPLIPFWTGGNVPEFSVETARGIIESLSVAAGIGVAIPLIAACYFSGHLLHWIARSGKPNQDAVDKWYKRLGHSLVFKIPRPTSSFNPSLKRLYLIVQKKFSVDDTTMEWREFYPIAKSYLAQKIVNSLVSTYQNKYTFHRSITIASAVLFWASFIGILFAKITANYSALSPNYLLLSTLLSGALMLVYGFSASFIYNWEMFGNTIITESYSKLFGPQDDQPKK